MTTEQKTDGVGTLVENKVPKCSLCSGKVWHVSYMRFPMWLCQDERCGCNFGFWTWIFWIIPFTGRFKILL